MSTALSLMMKEVIESARPPEELLLVDWAEKYRKIPKGGSPESGNFSVKRTPYMADIMNSISDPEVEILVLMFSAQMGKTELEINMCGYFAHIEPCSMMYLMPTLAMAEKISKDRLAPTIEASPALKAIFGANKSRATSSTILSKKFAGGVIHLCGANSAASLSSSPMRVLLADEIDRYGDSADKEGDPLTIAVARTVNFWNSKIVLVSTPTNEGTSRIDEWYNKGKRYHRELPCSKCGTFQELLFKNFKFDKNDETVEPYFDCVGCDHKIYNHELPAMGILGTWTCDDPEKSTRIKSYRINTFHSNFATWMDIRNKFLDSYKSPEMLKPFTNTILGEVWTETETLNDAEIIKQRRENYGDCPEDVLVIVAGVDTQDDSLHYEIVGIGEDQQSWGLEYGILRGDPDKPELWHKLHEKLSKTFERPDGVVMNVMKTCIDSAGHYTQKVYEFCKKYKGVYFPIVGRRGEGKPIINRPTVLKAHNNILLYTVGVDTCKETFLVSRLKQSSIAYGFCHYPFGRGYDDNYFNELTNIVAVVKKVKGVSRRIFEDQGRVEAPDCRVYSMAALEILNPSYHAIKLSIRTLKAKHNLVPKKVQKKKTAKRVVQKPKINRKKVKSMRKLRGK